MAEIHSPPVRSQDGPDTVPSRRPLRLFTQFFRHLRAYGGVATLRKVAQVAGLRHIAERFDYRLWRWAYDRLTDRDRRLIRAHVERLPARPRFSLILRLEGSAPAAERTVASVLGQLYPEWELWVIGQGPLAAADPRLRRAGRPEEAVPEGDFVACIEPGDLLVESALYLAAVEIAADPGLQLVYSDEDRIDETGRCRDPYFKPDWNRELFHAQPYIERLCLVRRARLPEDVPEAGAIAGLDQLARLVEDMPDAVIRHIPRVLCHRAGPPSRTVPAEPRPRHPLPDPPPRVSAIVPTRDRVDLLRQCIDGLLDETDYPDLEIIIVDNNSVEPATLAYFAEVQRRGVRVLPYRAPFNYSAINNFAARQAGGEVLLLLNNDIKVLHPDWLGEMVRQAVRPEVGAVGAKLFYPDGTLQHAGVVIGLGGVAGHLHLNLPPDAEGNHGDVHCRREVSCVTAACMALRRDVFDEVGGLDEVDLAVAFNDVDLCLKIRAKGYRILWTPFARLTHFESATRGSDLVPEKIARFRREHRLMARRWGAVLGEDPYYNPNLTQDGCQGDLAFPPRVTAPWR